MFCIRASTVAHTSCVSRLLLCVSLQKKKEKVAHYSPLCMQGGRENGVDVFRPGRSSSAAVVWMNWRCT